MPSDVRQLFYSGQSAVSHEFDESRDGLRQPVQRHLRAEANRRGLFINALVGCGPLEFQKGFQKSGLSDNRYPFARL